MTAQAASLTVDDLCKSYGDTPVLAGLSLDVQAGNIVGLLGPNGAGKSTAMRAFAGVADAQGAVTVATTVGVGDPFAHERLRAKIGYVPDVGGLFPRLSGQEHLRLAAVLYETDIEQYRDITGRLGMTAALSNITAEYSHGMSRKLSVVLALGHQPDVVLLDEPFDGVDPIGVREIRRLAKQAAERGACVVVSTHLLDAAEKLCDQLCVIKSGVIAAFDTPAGLAQRNGGDLEAAYVDLLEA